MNVPKVTVPWTVLSLLIALGAGLFVNYRVDAEWIAPVLMALLMAGLIAFGRITPRRASDE